MERQVQAFLHSSWLGRLRQEFRTMDVDGDGRISFADYAAGRVRAEAEQEPAAEALAEAFAEVDHDGDGKITIEELAEFFRWRGLSLTPEEVADRIRPWDADGDGRIDLGEMVRMLVG